MFFGIEAIERGYKMDWIEGECQEESPFTFWDMVKQRQRWFQGTFLASRHFRFNFSNSFLLFLYVKTFLKYVSPLFLLADMCIFAFPLSLTKWDILLCALNEVTSQYCFFAGTLNNFDFEKFSKFKATFLLLFAPIWTRYGTLIEATSMIMGVMQQNDQFYIVKK
jgi:cellulose synthase/poly-beta-1,6-N-acetylglucosamine synthase-like glycosyltransferase